MFVLKIGEYDVIFDSEEDYLKIRNMTVRKQSKIGIHVDIHFNGAKYARTSINRKEYRVHHLIVGFPPKGMHVDHINGNTLDNRRSNLRIVKASVNMQNKKQLNNELPRWVARTSSGKFSANVRMSLGSFDTPEEAHKIAYAFMKNVFPDLLIPEIDRNRDEQ
jgi:hypothetical protein